MYDTASGTPTRSHDPRGGLPPTSSWLEGRRGPAGLAVGWWGTETANPERSGSPASTQASREEGSAVEALRALAREGNALCLRLAMLLACIWRMDLSDLGYTSRSAFLDERIDVGTTWARQLVRLIESPLDLVKRAVARGAVPLRDAVEAPSNVEPEQQLAWILGLRGDASEAPSSPGVALDGADASAVREARRRARILLGRRANNETVDAFIVSVYERKVPLDELLSQARSRPAAPPEPGALAWDWCADEAPAQRALGPWVEPADLTEAMAQVDALKRQRDVGAARLARAWADADYEAVWAREGYESRWAFARVVCGWSRRTAQRRARVGWALHWFPALDEAVQAGMGLGTAEALVPVLDERNVDRWLAVAGRTSRRDLMDLVSAARMEDRVGETLARAEAAIAAVDAWQAAQAEGSASATPTAGDASEGSPAAAPTAPAAGDAPESSPAAAPTAGDAPLRVSMARPDAPTTPGGTSRPPRGVRATDGLVEAAWWWVENVVLPRQRGIGKIKERDRYTCQNPECRRTTLRIEAHHEQPRALGGSDDPINLLGLCRPCHLRGVHTGTAERPPRITTTKVRVGDTPALLWTFAGARQILQLRGELDPPGDP